MPLLSKVKDIFKGGSSAKKKKVYHNVRLDNPEENWEVIGELGDGAYGKVYKARRRGNDQLAALKQVSLEAEDDLDSFMVEIDILCECKHPNIVELLEAYHFDGKLWMYLEYCDGGAVDSIMVDLDRPLTEPQIATLCYDLCNALIYIHSNKVIHRDLKAGNVLLTMDGGVKLADFGVSAKNKNTFDKRGTFIGTPYWLAPEVILCETFIDAKYDYKADIWSLGISLIEFAQMDPPNHEVSPVRVMLKIQKSDPPKLDFPSRWSKDFNDFIAKCLTKDPALRPSAEDLLKHSFLTKSRDRKPIIDLLLEYNAEIVEEEVVEDSEDQDPLSRLNSTVSSESYKHASKFDTESLISLDKDSTLQSNYDDKMASPTLDDREAGGSVTSSERRMSKGPAPLPPGASASSQPPPKKGPAPAVPSVPLPTSNSSSSSSAISVSSLSVESRAESRTETVIASPEVPHTPGKGTSAVPHTPGKGTGAVPHTPGKGTGAEAPGRVTSTPTTDTPREIPDAPLTMSPIPASPQAKPPGQKGMEAPAEGADDPLDSIPVGKGVLVYTSEVYESDSVTVNRLNVSDVEVTKRGGTETETTVTSHVVERSEEGDRPPPIPSHVGDESPSPRVPDVAPVTLSVVPPSDPAAESLPASSSSDVLLASISSEGTVIVRTSTPSEPSSDVTTLPLTPQSVVTYTVAGDGELPSSSSVSPLQEGGSGAPVQISSVPSGKVPPSEGSSEEPCQSPSSLDEAEAQAVLILETAINSAMDSTVSKMDFNDLAPSPSVTAHGEVDTSKGGVVVVALDETCERDASGHKLDESEVLISSSSIPDEHKEEVQPRFEITLEDEAMFHPAKVKDDAHISVVEIEEDVVTAAEEEVTVVTGEPEAPATDTPPSGGVEDPTAQVSLTIEGTTLEDTDVDEVEHHATTTTTISNDVAAPEAKIDVDLTVNSGEPAMAIVTCPTVPSAPAPAPEPSEKASAVTPPTFKAPEEVAPLKPIQNGVRRQNSRASDRSDTDTTSTVGSDKENHRHADDEPEVTLRHAGRKPPPAAPPSPITAARNLKNKELQESIALRKKTRKRTRRFVIDGVVVTTTTSKVIYGDDEEQGVLSSAHLARKQELRELKLVQKREQKQFQDLALKANVARLEQEKKFELEKTNLLRNYDSQIENLIRQQKQLVEKAEARQESELKIESKRTRSDQERELRAFRESLKQEWKLLKQEVDLLPKDRRKENFKVRKEQLEREQTEREKACLERLNDSHEMALKRLNDKHRKHIALKERQFLEEKHQLLRARESALWDMEERHIQDKHQLAKEQLKDIYFLQRLQMTIRHNVELEQVRRFNQQKEESLLKRQQEERRQLPKRIRQEMKTREKMFREQIRISMSTLPSHDQEKEQLRKFHEQEKIKYDKERKRAEMKHKKQMEELNASTEASIKELVHLQNEKGKLLTEHETYKLKSLDEDYQKELREWKSNLAPRKQKLEEDFDRQLREQEKFYGDYLERGLGLCTPSQSTSSLSSSHH